jgi:predicted nucleotidyltransferase
MRSTPPRDFDRRELIVELARRLARHPAVERVWLFGSRARGDHFERSDIDLAIEAPSMDDSDWMRIKLEFEDEAPTPCSSTWSASRMRPSTCASRLVTKAS